MYTALQQTVENLESCTNVFRAHCQVNTEWPEKQKPKYDVTHVVTSQSKQHISGLLSGVFSLNSSELDKPQLYISLHHTGVPIFKVSQWKQKGTFAFLYWRLNHGQRQSKQAPLSTGHWGWETRQWRILWCTFRCCRYEHVNVYIPGACCPSAHSWKISRLTGNEWVSI